ncbi:MAG: sigma 54-interacting transcriptional regulator [Bacillota bacterium]|nr:sigma 54-interacting transcriptional regulator [Bacillota bacterium]
MKPVIASLSYGELTALVEKHKHSFLDSVEMKIINALFEDAIKIAQKMERNHEVDVFVCSGNSSLARYISTPFVEIKATGYDLLFALKNAKEYSEEVTIVSHRNNRIEYLSDIAGLIAMSVKQFNYGGPEEAVELVNRLAEKGVKNIIGPGLVFEIAKKLGMNATLIYSADGVKRTLETAVNIALSKKAESEKAERFRVIIDFAHEGIIATDNSGKVTVFNPTAEKFTKVKREAAIGRSIQDVNGNTEIPSVIEMGKPQMQQIQSIGDLKVIANTIPIIVNGEVYGAVSTFQDIGVIQESEENIRRKLYEKGLVAKFRLRDILGESEEIIEAKRTASLYAQSDSTILVTGESGTGKELFAQGMHNASNREKHPFVAINCQALPDNLLESELFGYEEGAFTGAKRGGKPGFFEIAHGGTIFLDEIGEISPLLQSRLLRVLEEREVMRIGSNKIIPVNIRVIAATNIDLWEMVKKSRFREDLYYRLNVLELDIPPLRTHKGDIPALVSSFITEFRQDITEDEITALTGNPLFFSYEWPGNIRELKNIVERFAVLYDRRMDLQLLLNTIFKRQSRDNCLPGELNEIKQVLKIVNGNKTKAAKKLGISRTTLWRKLKNCAE